MNSLQSDIERIAAFAEACRPLIGEKYVIEAPDEVSTYTSDFWQQYHGTSRCVVRPGSTIEVSRVVELASQLEMQLVVQGGNTGLVNGSIPDASGRQVVLSLGRLNTVREINATGDYMVVEAGCVLAEVQRAAAEVGRMFPLSLGAEGSCQIGGNIATNAGGSNVLRYGSARDQVLGLEVVLPSGAIWNGLQTLRKDNTGYDLKQLFIGSEGTLGIITAAVLRLVTAPRERVTLWLTMETLADILSTFAEFRSRFGDLISSFELMHANCVEIATEHLHGARRPVEDSDSAWHVLVELAWTFKDGLRFRAEEMLEELFKAGRCKDGALAESETQRLNMWRVREGQSEAAREAGAVVRSDISVAIPQIPHLLEEIEAFSLTFGSDVVFLPFGHVGDGNLHVNFVVRQERLPVLGPALLDHLFERVTELRGSISAEHGVGRTKRERIAKLKAGTPLQLMKRIKETVDPDHILNAGIGIA